MNDPRVRIYLASSLDGFIAGSDHDLSWLDSADVAHAAGETMPPGALDYPEFIQDIGALLMGRRTYDVVRGFGVPWPYGSRPVLVATRRPLDDDPPATVRAVQGSIHELVAQARDAAAGKDVYLDGGVLIRQAAEADLIDDLTITLAPIALGSGIPLFAGMERRYPLEIVSHHPHVGGMLQLRMRPKRG
ncbi:MAG: dihydrofolate reductase family protein [Gemmatimonadota bacterium]